MSKTVGLGIFSEPHILSLMIVNEKQHKVAFATVANLHQYV